MDPSNRASQHPSLPPKPVMPDEAAARRHGPAAIVEAQWLSIQLAWQWTRDVHEIRSPGRPWPGIVPLLKAAAAAPRLRRLYPFTSHFALLFSSHTGYPWIIQAGPIEPLHNGSFRVHRRDPSTVIGEFETAEEAVDLVVKLLPPDFEPVITVPADNRV
ncbi:DUF6193 family natural product biosynthesis protein [Streptomyces populi]